MKHASRYMLRRTYHQGSGEEKMGFFSALKMSAASKTKPAFSTSFHRRHNKSKSSLLSMEMRPFAF